MVIYSWIWINSKISSTKFHLFTEFCENRLSNVCVILSTNNKQNEKITSLAEIITITLIRNFYFGWHCNAGGPGTQMVIKYRYLKGGSICNFFLFLGINNALSFVLPSVLFNREPGTLYITGQETPRITAVPPSLRWLPVWRVDRGAMRRRISDTNACTTAHRWLRFN